MEMHCVGANGCSLHHYATVTVCRRQMYTFSTTKQAYVNNVILTDDVSYNVGTDRTTHNDLRRK